MLNVLQLQLKYEGLENFVIKEASACFEEHVMGGKLKNHEYAIVLKSLSQLGGDAQGIVEKYFQ